MRVFIVAVAPGLDNDPGLQLSVLQGSSSPLLFAEKGQSVAKAQVTTNIPFMQLNCVDILFFI